MIEVVDEGAGSNTRGTTRDRTAQAIHYYNNNVLKARTGSSRSSPYVYQQQQQPPYQQPQLHHRFRGGASSSGARPDNLYRSNSSLELLHDSNFNECHRGGVRGENCVNPSLKREYGSHGSIDVISIVDQRRNEKHTSERFLSMLQDYKPAVCVLISNVTLRMYISKSLGYLICAESFLEN